MASIDLSAIRLVRVPDWSADGAAPAFGGFPDPAAGFSGPAYVTEPWQPADLADLPGLSDAGFPGPTDAAHPGSGRGAAPGGADDEATTAWPRQFAQVMAEILAGVRPVRQIGPWAADHVLAQIRDLIPRFASDRQPRIRRVVTSQPAATAVEVTVVAAFGSRTRALAMRFEHVAARQAVPGLPARPARWLCTALEAG